MRFYLINDGRFRVSENNSKVSTLLACRQLLIQTGSENILIDSGIGTKLYTESYFNKFSITQPRQLENSLYLAGISPEKITKLILTHLHFDHVGGCSRFNDSNELKTVFLNSQVFVQKTEYEFALEQSLRNNSSYVKNNLCFFSGNSNVIFLDGNIDFNGLNLLLVGGHTPGLQVVRFYDNGQIYYFASDLIPTPFHINQSINPAGIDYDNEKTLKAKIKLLDQAVSESAIILFSHAPSVSAVRLISKENGKYDFKSVRSDSSFTIL